MTSRFLSVGLAAWIVRDGNYDDFRVGMDAAFALEFYAAQGLRKVEGGVERQLVRRTGSEHAASGQIVHMASDWWVVDAGLPVFQEETPPAGLAVGDFVQGDIHLGIDPFFYFEYLASRPGAPALIASWRVERIEMQTAPFIRTGNVFRRDEALGGWCDVAATDAWHDDGGCAEYVLGCTMTCPDLRFVR